MIQTADTQLDSTSERRRGRRDGVSRIPTNHREDNMAVIQVRRKCPHTNGEVAEPWDDPTKPAARRDLYPGTGSAMLAFWLERSWGRLPMLVGTRSDSPLMSIPKCRIVREISSLATQWGMIHRFLRLDLSIAPSALHATNSIAAVPNKLKYAGSGESNSRLKVETPWRWLDVKLGGLSRRC
jgi:hypothetical protein